MTKKVNDTLIWQSETFHLEEPPELPKHHDKIVQARPQPDMIDGEIVVDITKTTACRRGYIATWEVAEDQLYLTGF